MRFLVAITDPDWFEFLSVQQPDEVNFWQPSGSSQFHALSPSEPLLFKLHSPHNFIVGGGFFSHFSLLPLSFAWNAFETKNGAESFTVMRERVLKYRRQEITSDPIIGCIMLQQPFFFERDAWIPVQDWPRSIVRYKGYDDSDEEGQRLWNEVKMRLTAITPVPDESTIAASAKWGKPQVVLPRLGQGAFRVLVADAYKRTCAISGSHILHILDAAHIRPYSDGGTHSPTNGLLLRQDIHTLFDRGYLTITPEYRLEVSKRIREEFNNGKEYYTLHGTNIALPVSEQFRPARSQLNWHNTERFLG